MSSVEVVEISENDEDDDCVLESVIYEDLKIGNNKEPETILAESPLLSEFVETCLKLENSEGMKRVINRQLLKMYLKADQKFKESQEFEKSLRRAISSINSDPHHKFSHIKGLCEIFKSGLAKKRVQLITLSNQTKEHKSSSCKRKSEIDRNSKFPRTEIIDLDSAEEDSSMSILEPENKTDSELPDHDSLNNEKENDTCSQNRSNDDNKLLIPHKELEMELEHEAEPTVTEKIKKIEEYIATYKKRIAELDEQEVCDDNMNSPYIQSEMYKARIVSLYKELCTLTGEETVKKSKVNLKVLDGHPEGPVRRLEAFLNRNVGCDGHPPFPSFRDVVKCVLKANEEDELGWSKQQIVNEAGALFTHCGRALQKRRQRREWRDLLSKVEAVECGPDPADNDPELLARLEANKREAQRKENEILERYTRLQNAPPQKDVRKPETPQNTNGYSDDVKDAHDCSSESDNDSASSSDESCNDNDRNVKLDSHITSSSNFEHEDVKNDEIKQEDINSSVKIKKEPHQESNIGELLEELGENYTTIVEIEDSFVVVEISDSSDDDNE